MIEFNTYYYSILIIICIYLIYLYIKSSIYDQLLSGFYEAPVDFCNQANLDLFCLYLSNDVSISGNRSCYILASKDNELIINEATNANITQQFTWSNFSFNPAKPKYFNVSFDISENDVFPKEQYLRFYPDIGKVVLYAGDTITAVLYKNGAYSELKHINDEECN